MTETGRFFDAVSYTESDQAEVQRRFRADGVLGEVTNLLAVGAPGGMFVSVAAGEAMVQGFWYKNTASKNLAIATNTSGSTRIDRIVLRLLRTTNNLTAVVVQGTPGAGLPTITQVAGGDWDYPLATVTVPTATTTVVTATMLADVRTYNYTLTSQDTVNGEMVAETTKGVYKTLVVDPATKIIQWAEYAQPKDNHLDNPTLRFNQRGTTSITGPSTAILADRWHTNLSDNKYTAVWVANTSLDPAISGGSVPFVFEMISNGSAVPAGGSYAVYQAIEGYTWSKLVGQPLVVSWWDWSTIAATYCLTIQSGGSDRTFTHPYTVPVAGAWVYNWVAIPAINAGTFGVTNGAGAFLQFVTGAGSSVQTPTADAWVTGNFLGHTSISNTLITNGWAHYVGAPKLEIGHIPSRFVIPDFVTDQQRCYRQFWMPNTGSNRGFIGVAEATANVQLHHVVMPVPMRTNPSHGNVISGLVGGGPGASANCAIFVMRTGAYMTGTFSSSTGWDAGTEEGWFRTTTTGAAGIVAGDVLESYFGTGCNLAFGAEL